jgi:hypothetical protein
MTHASPTTNLLKLSADARQANAEREQKQARREGLFYIEQETGGAVFQFWVRHIPNKPIEEYTPEDFHRPGNRPAIVKHLPLSTAFEYFVDGSEMQARTDGGPTRCTFDEHGNPDSQEWSNPRADGGPQKIFIRRGDDHPTPVWMGTPTLMDKLPDTKAEAKTALGYIEEHELSAHARLRWEALKAKQGGVFWRPTTEQPEARRPGGVKAAAAAAAAKAIEPIPTRPKTADRGDAR